MPVAAEITGCVSTKTPKPQFCCRCRHLGLTVIPTIQADEPFFIWLFGDGRGEIACNLCHDAMTKAMLDRIANPAKPAKT